MERSVARAIGLLREVGLNRGGKRCSEFQILEWRYQSDIGEAADFIKIKSVGSWFGREWLEKLIGPNLKFCREELMKSNLLPG